MRKITIAPLVLFASLACAGGAAAALVPDCELPPPINRIQVAFAQAVLVSLADADQATNAGASLEDENPNDMLALMTSMMRSTKLSTIDFQCAHEAVAPFATAKDHTIQVAGEFLEVLYAGHLSVNERTLKFIRSFQNAKQSEIADQLSSLQLERSQLWHDMWKAIPAAVLLLVDDTSMSKSGKFDRLLVTKKQRDDLLKWLRERMPHVFDGTKRDKLTQPAQMTSVILEVFKKYKCADE